MRFAILILSFILISGCDSIVNLTDEEYIAKAQDFLDKREPNSAVIELKNALKQNPDNTEARWLLGKLYIETGNGPAAEKELRKAREIGASNESVTPLVARALLLQGKFADVLELSVDSEFSEKTIADLLASRGLSYIFQSEPEKAQTELDTALQKDPLSTYALVERARLATVQQKYEDAHRFLDQALSVDEEFAPAWSLRGDLYRMENNPAAAVDAYSKAINNSFNTARDLQHRSLAYIQLKQYQEAQQDADRLAALAPRHPDTLYLQGLIHLTQRQFAKANESFESCLEKNSNYMTAIYYTGVTHFLQGNLEQSDAYLSRYQSANPGSVQGRKMLALVKYNLGEYSSAEELVRPVVNANNEDIEALNILANSLLLQGQLDEVMPLMEKAVALNPESAATRMRLGISLLLQDDMDRAAETLQTSIDIDPQFKQSELLLVLHHLNTGSHDKALEVANAFTEKHPDTALAHNLRGKTYLARKEDAKATEAFDKARQIAPGDPFACRNLAILALRNDDPDEARSLFNEILDHNKGHLATMSLLAALEEREGNFEAMKSILQEAVNQHPDAVTPRVLLARQYLTEGKAEQVFTVLNKDIRSKYPDNPVVLGILGRAELETKSFRQAKITFQQLVELQPGSPNAHYRLAMAYAGLDQSDDLKNELEKVLALAPMHPRANLALAKVWLLEGNTEKATERLEALQKVSADHPDILSLEGEILAKSGQTNKALAVYQELHTKYPSTRHLLMMTQLQWANGNHQAAIDQLESWLRQHPEDIAARQTLAEAYAELGRTEDATRQYEDILRTSQDNPVALNDLAWNLKESDPGKALAFAEKANSIAPDSPSIMDTMATILLMTGDTARARRLIGEALEKQPDSPTFHFRRAMLLETTGDTEAAIVELTTLLEKNQAFPERGEAESMLTRLKKP